MAEREYGWLVEREQAVTDASAPRWWNGRSWSTDANEAIRFTRKIDADRFINSRIGWRGFVHATEHIWDSGSRDQAHASQSAGQK